MAATAEAERTNKASDARKTRTPRTKPTGGKSTDRHMTQEHKDAIAEGREQARIVGKYLEALAANKPKRGRKVTEESLQRQLDNIEGKLADADPLDKLILLQQKKDLTKKLETKAPEVDLKALETEFIKVAKPYAVRKSIEHSTFRELDVPAEVLKAAGI